MEGTSGEMYVDGVSAFDRMGMGGCRSTAAAEEFSAHEASVDVRSSGEGDGAGGFKVEIEEGAIYRVEVRAAHGGGGGGGG